MPGQASIRFSKAFVVRCGLATNDEFPTFASIISAALHDSIGWSGLLNATPAQLEAMRQRVLNVMSADSSGSVSVSLPHLLTSELAAHALPGETTSAAARRLLADWFGVPVTVVEPPGPAPRERARSLPTSSLDLLLSGTFISVANMTADVCRRGPDGHTEVAVNNDDLRLAAEVAVESQGYHLNISGIYHCPPELARRAVWSDKS